MGCHFSAPGSFLVFPDSFLPILLCAAGSFPCQETKDNEQQDIHMAVLMFPGTPWIRHFHEICCQWSGQECCPGFSHPPDLYGTAPGFPAVHQIFWIRPYSHPYRSDISLTGISGLSYRHRILSVSGVSGNLSGHHTVYGGPVPLLPRVRRLYRIPPIP